MRYSPTTIAATVRHFLKVVHNQSLNKHCKTIRPKSCKQFLLKVQRSQFFKNSKVVSHFKFGYRNMTIYGEIKKKTRDIFKWKLMDQLFNIYVFKQYTPTHRIQSTFSSLFMQCHEIDIFLFYFILKTSVKLSFASVYMLFPKVTLSWYLIPKGMVRILSRILHQI